MNHAAFLRRKDLVPKQEPALGEYNDSDPAVIAAHLCWSRYARIGVWVTSWWGPLHISDNTTRSVILPHPELGDLQIAVHYESRGRTKDPITGERNMTLILERAGPDVLYLCEHYFAHPNYLRIDGKPVLVFYLSRSFEQAGLMREATRLMREAAQQCGEQGIYLVGDHAFRKSFLPLDYLDAITNYDVHNSLNAATDGYAYQAGIDQYTESQGRWRDRAHQQGVQYVPAVIPGFNNRALANPSSLLSRRMAPDWPLGSLFEETLRQARNMVDPSANNLLFVVSWNEWHEDTVRACARRSNCCRFATEGLVLTAFVCLFWFHSCSKLNRRCWSRLPRNHSN